ncbi:MAG: endolytic transglycosylase MltG [Patescibacteria group bacterium]
MNKKNNFFIIPAIVLAIFLFIFIEIQAPDFNSQEVPVIIDISSGQGLSEIAGMVHDKNLAKSEIFFKVYAILRGRAHRFQAGRYIFSEPVSVSGLVEIFSQGPKEISVTIVPGMTIGEIDHQLALAGVIKKNELINFKEESPKLAKLERLEKISGSNIKNLEGFLLPDTYRFYQNSKVDFVVDKVLSNFEDKALTFLRGNDNIYQILILASLLEKEVPDYGERQIAAAIFKRRLKVGMALQVDATIIYAKCQEAYLINCPELKKEDYKIDSPYNTYLYPGLPPAPISNPSLESIQAVINSKDLGYWYYLSDPKTKKTIFSKTLDEHNQNRAIYLLN